MKIAGRPIPRRVKRVALTTSELTGQLTQHARMLPDFLIVGAQRSGTTSMYKTLSQHPAVLKAVLRKGVHYFDVGYTNGPGWYRAQFPLQYTATRRQRALGVRPLTGESSPYYMFHPLAAERIARDLPSVRLIVLLRDPVERAYSAHTHEVARGYDPEKSFEHALELEEERTRGEAERIIADPTYNSHSLQHQSYVARGRYVEQIERLERAVGRDRIHVVDSQDFFEKPEPAYREVLSYLGLPELGSPDFEQHNARPRSPMSDSLRTKLDEYFLPYDERLAGWLGATPSWRR